MPPQIAAVLWILVFSVAAFTIIYLLHYAKVPQPFFTIGAVIVIIVAAWLMWWKIG